jgi:hypothetical protein
MKKIYAMRRANGDWFAFDDHGRFLVPIFHNSGDAMIARSHNVEMQVFKPVALDSHLLKQLAPPSAGDVVNFCVVSDPVAKLSKGHSVDLAHISSLVGM